MERYGIFPRYADMTFEKIKELGVPKGCITGALKTCEDYCNNFGTYGVKGEGLNLIGTFGMMKTTLATAIVRDIVDRGYSAYMISMPSLIDTLFTLMNLNKKEQADFEHKIRTTKLLVLDDFGGQPNTVDWVKAKITSIITDRYNKMLPTIITSNETPQDLEKEFSGRVWDRLRSTNKEVPCVGKSLRNSRS